MKKQKLQLDDLLVCPESKLTLHNLKNPLFPEPWKSFEHYNSQTPSTQIMHHEFTQELSNQIERLKKRYSKPQYYKKKYFSVDKNGSQYDIKEIEREILNGNRLKFKSDLSYDLILGTTPNKENIPTFPAVKSDSVQVGSVTVSKSIALPKYLNDKPKPTRDFKKPQEFQIRKFSHIDDLVERVRLQQVDILKKYKVKAFSKDVQGKLKDELFIILKQFQ